MKSNKYWFKPKRFGYGAEPTTWEGWALIAVFVIFVIGLSMFLVPERMNDFYWAMGISMLVLVLITKAKTDGEWKWNWGKKKEEFEELKQ